MISLDVFANPYPPPGPLRELTIRLLGYLVRLLGERWEANMKVQLVRLAASSLRKRTTLKRFPAVVGRSSEADVYLDDPWASRSQCKLSICEDTLVVRDLKSRNGTFVNGERIETSRLQSGDQLVVGRIVFRIELSYQKSLLERIRCRFGATSRPADVPRPCQKTRFVSVFPWFGLNSDASHARMADSVVK